MVEIQAGPALQQALALAAESLSAGDPQGADRALAPLLDRFPADPRLLHMAGMVRMHQQKAADAAQLFSRARAADPRAAQLAFSHGTALQWLEQPEEAVAAFRDAFRSRRCLVPADGFYEWKRQNRSKQPYYIRLNDGRPFAFAGMWQRWQRAETLIDSCTILTTDANELVAALHDRMPVILDPQQFEQWLDPAVDDPEILSPLLAPYPADRMTAYPVSRVVNSPHIDGPACIEPAVPGKTQGSLFD